MRTRGLYVRLRTSPDLCEQVIILILELVLLLLQYYVRTFQRVLQVTPTNIPASRLELISLSGKSLWESLFGLLVASFEKCLFYPSNWREQISAPPLRALALSSYKTFGTPTGPKAVLAWAEVNCWSFYSTKGFTSLPRCPLAAVADFRQIYTSCSFWIWNFASQCVPFSSIICLSPI